MPLEMGIMDWIQRRLSFAPDRRRAGMFGKLTGVAAGLIVLAVLFSRRGAWAQLDFTAPLNSSAPGALNPDAASYSLLDFFPQLTIGGLGAWVVVWESTDSFGRTMGRPFPQKLLPSD